ncbi:MAG: EamA family transporter [Candidatus Aenigmatarchaeota archaeon]
MKKEHRYLLIAFVAIVIASFFSKVGATTMDRLLFILIAYSIGSSFAFARYLPNRKVKKETKKFSIKIGIIIGMVNFITVFSIMTALSTGPGVVIFPLFSLNLALIVTFSVIIFKEKINWRRIVGIVLALIAMLLLV